MNENNNKISYDIRQYINEKEYWMRKLSEEFEKSYLPYDNQVRSIGTAKQSYEIQFSDDTALKILRVSKNSMLKAYMVLAASVAILLNKYTGEEKIILAMPLVKPENEPDEYPNDIVPLVITLKDEMSFKDILMSMRQTVVEAANNQYYPLNRIIEQLGLAQDSGFALSDVLVSMQGIHIKNSPNAPYTNVEFAFCSTSEQIGCTIYYNPMAYTLDTIRMVGERLNGLLESITANFDIILSSLSICSEIEAERILNQFNNTNEKYDINGNVYTLFEMQASKTPDNVAVVDDNSSLTYSELSKEAGKIADILVNKGVKSNDVVGVLTDKSTKLVSSMMGVLKSSAAYLPIDTEYPLERIKHIINDSGTNILITTEKDLDKISYNSIRMSVKKPFIPTVNCKREQIENLDEELPLLDRSLVDYEKYKDYIGQAMVKNSIAIQATRGCPYNCVYCHKIWENTHHRRSPENIYNEIKLYYDLGVRRFVFIDDIFNFDLKEGIKLFKMIIENNLKIHMFFPNGLRGDILTPEYIDLMVQAGTVHMALALETASPRLQKLIGKNINIPKLKANIEYITEKYPDVMLDLFTLIGIPGETVEEIEQTMDFVKSIKWLYTPIMGVLKVFPNTSAEKLALSEGISREAIEKSLDLPYYELPDTLTQPKSVIVNYQTRFLKEYFLSRERLLHVLPRQMKLMTEDELVMRYNAYLPKQVNNFDELLSFIEVKREELGDCSFLNSDFSYVPGIKQKLQKIFPPKVVSENPFKVLLIDLSSGFTIHKNRTSEIVEPPMGLLYLQTYINDMFKEKVDGKIIKSKVDFDNYKELKKIIDLYKPHLIGIRTLSVYRDFFHKTVSVIRQWGIKTPIIAGGPYATSSYDKLLLDKNVDLVVIGEGERTFGHLVDEFIRNDYKMPSKEALLDIPGIAYIDKDEDKKEELQFSREVIILDDIADCTINDHPKEEQNMSKPDDLAYVIYTSGSTGKPKGVMISHKSLLNFTLWRIKATGMTQKDTSLQLISPSFDGFATNLYPALLTGGKSVIYKGLWGDFEAVKKLIRSEGVTNMSLIPAMYKHIIESIEPNALNSLRYVVLAAEKADSSLITKSKQVLPEVKLINEYGPTECTITSIANLEMDAENTANIGSPIGNVKAYIVGKNMSLQPVGVPGEICISGVNLARGYINNQLLTAEKFINSPFDGAERIYRTGDIGKWNKDGTITYIGRKDYQVKIRGFRIETGEIECIIRQFEGIKDCYVMDRAEDDMVKYLCAYIVSETDIDEDRLREYILGVLPDYMVPSFFVKVDRIPLTPNRKVNRDALPEPKKKGVQTNAVFVKPRNKIEEEIVRLWQEVLKSECISVTDNFFNIGGNSFNALTVVSKANGMFTLQDLFECPVVEKLAERISNKDYSSISVLSEFGKPKDKQSFSVICIPYGGGNAIVYQPLAEAIKSRISDVGFYVLNLPGRGNTESDALKTVEQLAQKCFEEIRDKICTPTVIYGHCGIGATVSVELAKMLEDAGMPAKTVYIGAAVPPKHLFMSKIIKSLWNTLWENKDNSIVVDYLKKVGFDKEMDVTNLEVVAKNFKDDFKMATDYYSRNISRIRKWKKLNTPLVCFLGDKDPAIKNFSKLYKDWYHFANEVELVTVKDGDHYFISSHQELLADKICCNLFGGT